MWGDEQLCYGKWWIADSAQVKSCDYSKLWGMYNLLSCVAPKLNRNRCVSLDLSSSLRTNYPFLSLLNQLRSVLVGIEKEALRPCPLLILSSNAIELVRPLQSGQVAQRARRAARLPAHAIPCTLTMRKTAVCYGQLQAGYEGDQCVLGTDARRVSLRLWICLFVRS